MTQKMIVRRLQFPRVRGNILVAAACWAILVCLIWLGTFAHLMRHYADKGGERSVIVNKVLELLGKE